MPFKYDDRTKRFMTTGHFCSWECIKRYSCEMNDARWGERQMFIGLMRKHANNNKHVATGMAPKRPALTMFGGTLSIDEFRRGSSNVIVTMPWETHVMPTLTYASSLPSVPVAVQSKDDSLVLRRNKPLARAKSSLEASLGITRKTK